MHINQGLVRRIRIEWILHGLINESVDYHSGSWEIFWISNDLKFLSLINS